MFLTNTYLGIRERCECHSTASQIGVRFLFILDILIPVTAVVLSVLSLANVIHFLPQSVTWGFVSGGGALVLATIGMIPDHIAKKKASATNVAYIYHN